MAVVKSISTANKVPIGCSTAQPQRMGSVSSRGVSVLDSAAHYGYAKVTKHYAQSFGLAIFAGAFIALAFVFYITVTTGADHQSWGLVRFAGGVAFSMGLILVVVLGGELFTSTVLSTIAWAQKRVSTGQLLFCWLRVYVGNMVGAIAILALVMVAQLYHLNGSGWGLNALQIAQHKIHHSWGQAFALGLLCNLLVCLGVWLTFTSKDVLTKALLSILPVAMFVSSGFEHSIANLFMVPLGIAIEHYAGDTFFSALALPQQTFADLTISHFVWNNLIPVTLGNIVGGGVVVGLGNLIIESSVSRALPESVDQYEFDPTTTSQMAGTSLENNNAALAHKTHTTPKDSIMNTQLKKLIVSELMDTQALTLNIDLDLYQALIQLTQANVASAPVVDADKRLLGFVSEQDLIRVLWSEEYAKDISIALKDIMQTHILTVAPTEKVVQLLECMVVDKDKLFPVTTAGMYVGDSYQSYEQRLRLAAANKPSCYPVVENGYVCGVIQRHLLAQMLATLYRPEYQQGTHPVDHQSVA